MTQGMEKTEKMFHNKRKTMLAKVTMIEKIASVGKYDEDRE